jgi:radical SAM superfamily enzyme YgiQ (UPF0313 family)
MTAINSAISDISEHFPTIITNTGDTQGDTWMVKAKWLFNKEQIRLNKLLDMKKETRNKAEIKRQISNLRDEYTSIDEMIEASGIHGWEDVIEGLEEDMQEIENKIDNLRKQL